MLCASRVGTMKNGSKNLNAALMDQIVHGCGHIYSPCCSALFWLSSVVEAEPIYPKILSSKVEACMQLFYILQTAIVVVEDYFVE